VVAGRALSAWQLSMPLLNPTLPGVAVAVAVA